MDPNLQNFKSEFFKALGHPVRIRILELLCEGAKSVNELQQLMFLEGSAVSQQLTILRTKNIVVGAKQGNKVIYTLKDPAVIELLAVAKKIFNNHLIDQISILNKINS